MLNWKLGAETATYTNVTATIENTITHGPWVSGGGNESSDAYKKAFSVSQNDEGDYMVNCQALRLIGDLPTTVYESSSLRYGWGEVPDFKDVPESFKVTAATHVFSEDLGTQTGSGKTDSALELSWVNSYSSASGLTAAAAGLTLLAAMMF